MYVIALPVCILIIKAPYFKKTHKSRVMGVAVSTGLSAKKPHRQVGAARVVTSGSLGGVMVSTQPNM